MVRHFYSMQEPTRVEPLKGSQSSAWHHLKILERLKGLAEDKRSILFSFPEV